METLPVTLLKGQEYSGDMEEQPKGHNKSFEEEHPGYPRDLSPH